MKDLINNPRPACLYLAFSTLLFGIHDSAFSKLKANNFTKLCVSIGNSVVFHQGMSAL